MVGGPSCQIVQPDLHGISSLQRKTTLGSLRGIAAVRLNSNPSRTSGSSSTTHAGTHRCKLPQLLLVLRFLNPPHFIAPLNSTDLAQKAASFVGKWLLDPPHFPPEQGDFASRLSFFSTIGALLRSSLRSFALVATFTVLIKVHIGIF